MAEKRRFKVQIDNQTYTIIGTSSTEHMNAVVEIVETQLQEIQKLMPELSKEKAAILLALNAVSDQLYKQEKLSELLDEHEQVEE